MVISPGDLGLRFDLPFCIHLQNGPYEVHIGDRPVTLILRKVWRPPHGGSDDDSVEGELRYFKEGAYTSGSIGGSLEEAKAGVGDNYEAVEDTRGRFRFTRVVAWLEHERPGEADANMALSEAIEAVNWLVDVFRYVSWKAYLPPVVAADIEFVEIVAPSARRAWFRFIAGRGFSLAVVNESRSVHERVRAMLSTAEEIPLDADLRLTARRLVGQNLWRQAIVEAVSSLDAYLGALFAPQVEAGQLTEEAFEELMNEPLSDRMKKPLRVAVGCSPVDDSDLWNRWIAANRIRRGVVHRGRRASEQDANNVLEAVEGIVTYIDDRR